MLMVGVLVEVWIIVMMAHGNLFWAGENIHHTFMDSQI